MSKSLKQSNQPMGAVEKVRAAKQRFASDRKGTVAMIFTFALLPIVGAVGLAVDYSRAISVRGQLQAAVDGAAMAGAVSKNTTPAARETAANNTFDANVANAKHGATFTRSATPGAGQFSFNATATVRTLFMQLVTGTTDLTIDAASTVNFGGKNLELAIVLDTTGSMNDSVGNGQTKLDALKAAVPTILDIVMPTGSTNAKVALIPFAKYVNVGSTNTALLTGRVAPYQNMQCVLERKHGSRPNESAPDINNDEFWIKTSNSSCSSIKPITPLTSNRAVLDTAMQNLSAGGGTAGHLGVQWAWHAISPLWASRWPAGSAPVGYTDSTTMKAIVVLTDGNLTEFHRRQNKTSSSCNGTSDCLESRTEAKNYCDAIKTHVDADNKEAVRIFTIGFGLESASTSDGQKARETMKYCASYDQNDPETDLTLKKKHFYFPVTEQDLQAAFANIGNSLTEAVNKPRFTN